VRHKARSIAEVVREHMSRRAYLLFLAFVWISLVYIIVAFTDLTASTFAPAPAPAGSTPEAVAVAERNIDTGKAVASSSMMYLALAMIMGLTLRFTKLPLAMATAIFLPLVLLTIWAGPLLPLELPGWIAGSPAKTWDAVLLVYCFAAGVVPMWLLLQPRGYLGGYFLTVTVGAAFLGIVAASFLGEVLPIQYPAFKSFEPAPGVFLFPILFVTIACGACSGFHSIVSSGTSSKQLRRESDALPIGFGCMLLEGFVAVISLSTVMVLAPASTGSPDRVFSEGVSRFIAVLTSVLGVDYEAARGYLLNFALLAFATFIYDTLDVCTRLGRYVLQEFTGWQSTAGRYVCTVLTLLPPAYLVLQTMHDPITGQAAPAWKIFWTLFGTANQMLAALTLVGVTVWLIRTGKTWWYAAVPAAFMLLVTLTSLSLILWQWLRRFGESVRVDPNGPICMVLFVLAILLVLEAAAVISRSLRLARV
jgi:carbon starvation protein